MAQTMTAAPATAATAARFPVLEAAEIALPAMERGSFLVLAGAGEDASEAAFAVARTVAPHVVRVAEVAPGFRTLDGIAAVFAAVLPVVEREAPELLEAGAAPGSFLLDPYRVKEIGVSHIGESVTFAVTRRISRESHDAALVVDRIARSLLEIQRRCPTFREGLALFVPSLERWDRPSLRCLYRAVLLTEAGDRLAVVATATTLPDAARPDAAPAAGAGPAGGAAPAAGAAVPPGPAPLERIAWARARFFHRLGETGVVRILPGAGAPLPSQGWGRPPVPGSFPDLLLAMGDALVFQNYERVYHLGDEALRRARDPEEAAQAHRLLGIAHAQLEDFDGAVDEIDRAAGLTARPAFGAHLAYLAGLIQTKRRYDPAGAMRRYGEGLALLGGAAGGAAGADPVEERVERAWLLNGRALALTLQAKACEDAADRERLMSQSFALELEAFELVKETGGAASSYLRHNLLANLTFLLEISGRFKEAVRFWRRAFERYLATDSQSFKSVFAGRLGQLLFKSGERAEGTAVLEEARDLCRRVGDPFHEEEVCIALGYCYSAMGDLERAHAAYRSAFDIARRLRDLDICDASLSGMLWCLATAGAAAELEALREAVVAAVPGTPLAERLAAAPPGDPLQALRACGVERPLPSPKLRAYIPSVDLEGTPRQDLNRYLVWSRGPLGRHGPDDKEAHR